MFKKKFILYFMPLFALAIFAGSAFAGKASVQVNVGMDKSAFAWDEGLIVKVSVSNPGKAPVRLLRWATPIDGIQEDLFRVVKDGKEAGYIGPHYKRPAPGERDYITLKGGEAIDYQVDISEFYDLSESGLYQISYRAASYNLFSSEANYYSEVPEIASESKQAWVEGRPNYVPDLDSDSSAVTVSSAVTGPTSFTSCSTSRQSSLITARNNASAYSANSYSYLAAGTTGSRYTWWFGTYNSSRYSTVRSHFLSIRNAMDTASVRFNCSCTSSAYAFVYPAQPYTIYLCNAFWSAPSTGTDSKAGTLVHEMSHFNVVAGTDDWAYGQTAAHNLAVSNPARAVDNADNHEYFAENTPARP